MELHFTKGSRPRIIAFLVVAVMAVFVARLFYIQVIQHGFYVGQADSEQIKKFTLHATRGEIYAMDGNTPTKLVLNQTVYTVWADPTLVADQSKVVDALNKVAGGNVRDNFAQYLNVKNSRYQVLATNVTYDQAKILKAYNLPGVGFDATARRVYPEGPLASQLLGFVNAEGNGVYGLEQAEDGVLKGQDGMLSTVTDVRDVPLTIGDKNVKTPAKNGTNIVLTVDRNIQSETEQALAAGAKRSGATNVSAVVMDPSNGHVLAMANLPTYDPSKLNEVTDVADFNNDVISMPYEPASVIKTFTLAAGIDKGVVTPESTYDNTGSVQVEDIVINNATKAAFLNGPTTMQTALDWSLNTGMVALAKRLGDGTSITKQARSTIYDYFHDRLRLGQLTGIELANEAQGIIYSPDNVQGNAVRYSNMVFGQGMDVTMMQVASGFSAIINGGTYHEPTVIGGTIGDDGEFVGSAPTKSYPNVISASTSATMRGMIQHANYATWRPRNEPAGFYVGGKTGTSQVIVNGKYVLDQTIGTYIGFGGEVDKIPKYVIMVEISADGKALDGGSDAKPIFNDISNYLLNYLKLSPK
ncbi:MAG: penicillin-binding protein 2 [Candidatus Saccharimonas sp.]